MITQSNTKRMRAIRLALASSLVAVLMTATPVAADHANYCGHAISPTYVHMGSQWRAHFKYEQAGGFHRVWYYRFENYAPGGWAWIKRAEASHFCH